MSLVVHAGNVSEVARLVHERNQGLVGLIPRRFDVYPLGEVHLQSPESHQWQRVRTWAEANMPIIPEAEWEERLAAMQDRFPKQRNAAAGTKDTDQNGYGYCWTASGTECIQSCNVLATNKYVELAWESAGGAVGWANRGNSLVSWLNWASKYGICRREFVPWKCITPSKFKQGWQEDALNYRILPSEIYDLGAENMWRETVSAFLSGFVLYVAFNWANHAMQGDALSKQGNELAFETPNTWGANQRWVLTGRHKVPSEAYAIRVVQAPVV